MLETKWKKKQKAKMKIPKSIDIFARSQVSAFIGGVVDYLAMIFFTEIVGIHYVASIALGGIVGGVVNYSINRYWAFDARDGKKRTQLPKYLVVAIGSILLKSSGTYALTEWLRLDYRISRLIIDAFVAFGFNFMLQKYWVFKKTDVGD